MILLLTLLIPMLTANESTPSPLPSESDYGIDLERRYTGQEVEELLRIAETEALAAIEDAYAEGYKAGLMTSVGDAAYWKSIAEQYQDRSTIPFWIAPAAGLASFFIGAAAGFSAAR